MRMPKGVLIAAVGLTLAARQPALPASSLAPQARSGLDLSGFDRSVRPQDDLFQFANGGWLSRVEIPPDQVSATAFTELVDKADADVRGIIEDLVARARKRGGSTPQQIADLYTSITDEVRIESLGATPMQPELRKIDAMSTPREFAAEAGYLATIGMGAPFFTTVAADANNASLTVVQVSQGGILLPDRDYYLSADPVYADIRAKYEQYLVTVFTLAGRPEARSNARAVLALETALATAEWTQTETHDPARTGTRFGLEQLPVEMPGFDWRAWAGPQGIDHARTIVVAQPSFFKRFAALVPATPLATWKAWLAARYITAIAPYVSRPFGDARFEFFGRVLSGQVAPRPRWRRGVGLVNTYLGQAIGRLYVEKHFPPASRARVQKIVTNLVQAYRESTAALDWMAPATRSEALRKLSRLTAKIGYPDVWRDYSGLVIKPDDLVGNIQRGQKFDNDYRLARLGGLKSEGEWPLSPQAVNAFYSPGLNEIFVPAAFLQPPLFDVDADVAANYGAIGAVIGHELAHGFDDQGRRFDAAGAGRIWWTPQDERAYRERARRLAAQLDTYRPFDNVHLNGDLVLDESLGDLIGLSVAHRAYTIALAGRPAGVIDGFTGAQRFFLGWAQVWRSKMREEFARQQITVSPHPPPAVRANGPVSEMDAFYEAFGVKPGDALYRAAGDRIRIW